MELEMSIGKSLGLWGRARIASVVLTVLYGGIYELYQTDPRIQKQYDTCITFKSLETAFLVLTGRMGIAGAYAAHGFSLHGDIGTAMELTRCVDLAESYLFPKIMTRRILKEVAKKRTSSLVLYARILVGLLRGAYTPARGEKKTFRQMRMEQLRGESGK